MAKMNGLAHVGLFISDLEQSKAFYTNILGFEVIWECALEEADQSITKIAFVKNGSLTLELVQRAFQDSRSDGWIDHIALAVEDIEEIQKTLEAHEIQFETKTPVFNNKVFPNGSKWLMFRGPDNEHLEISEVIQ